MLASLELGADFSAGCARSVIRPAFLTTHPHCLTIRELTPATGIRSKVNGAGSTSWTPSTSIRYMRLGHKRVDVVVEAVVHAVDVA
jgi:hypothetical protein